MTPREIIEKLGLEVLVASEEPAHTVGAPPTLNASIVKINGKVKVWVRDESDRMMIDGIHEALHAVNGPKSFDDELYSGLMAAEWVVCQALDRPVYKIWRETFGTYTLDPDADDIGESDDFLKSDLWLNGEISAAENGLLDDAGEPVWGRGPHPDLAVRSSLEAPSSL